MPHARIVLLAAALVAACLSAAGCAGLPSAQVQKAPASLASTLPCSADGQTYDLVVVGGTPCGIACAVRAAREGLRVLLVNRHEHLGGIVTSGLGVWDTEFEGHRSPIYDEVRQALFDYYRTTYGPDSPQYKSALPGKSGHTNGRYEPRVAEKILNDLVAREKRITVLLNHVPVGVERRGDQVTAVTFQAFRNSPPDQKHAQANSRLGMPPAQGNATAGSIRVSAAVFADATYEGDLAAMAKVPYRVAREARSEFNEPHAGIIYMKPFAQPPTPQAAAVAALHDALALRKFPGWQVIMPESTGAADPAVQACNYRTIITKDPANRVPVSQPANYAPYFLKMLEVFSGVESIPNNKFGWNRPQLIGRQTPWVEADWTTRKQIEDEHWEMTLGLLYFLQNDPTVPEPVRRGWLEYGLAKDEFVDNGNRPYELYIREARRIDGRAIFTEHDATLAPGLARAPVHADSVAVTEWYMDSHTCTLGRVAGGLDEGKMMLHLETFPGQIPYRCLLPQGVDNLLVPLCLSSTHVAWGSVRLEPVFMQTGEAAGVAAAMAVKGKIAPARIDSDRLVRKLAELRFMLAFFNDVDVAADAHAPAAAYFGAKGFFADYNAQPNEPLSSATGKVWAEGFAQLLAGRLDPMALVRRIATADADRAAAPMTAAEFAALLPAAAKTQEAGKPGPISRKEALGMMFARLP